MFEILKKRFLFLKKSISLHFPEDVESVFVLCCGMHNLLYDSGANNYWGERLLINGEAMLVGYDSLDQTDIVYEIISIYYNFLGNYTIFEFRRLHPYPYMDEDKEIDTELSRFALVFEQMRDTLINYYSTIVDELELQFDLN